MASYIRRFLFDPGNQVLLNIESVNILDLTPPAAIAGVGTGTAMIVGECENGPYNTPYEVGGTTDLVNTFGQLGYTYNGVPGNNSCAVQRFADGALSGEFWNGNAFVQLNGKQFANLVVVRPDTSVGFVQFTACAFITGAAAFRYVLAAGQILSLDVGSGPTSATFTATAATVTSSAQTFPDGFVGGEQLTLGVDGLPNFVVTFLPGDTTQALVIARINQYAGFTMAASVTGTTMSLTGLQKGNQAQVRVVGASAGGILTTLGLTVATNFGTGNVANILAVTPQEVATVVQAAISNTRVEVDQNSALRISNTLGTASSFVLVSPATTASGLGFTAGQLGTQLGVAAEIGTGGTFPATNSGSFSMSYDNGIPFTVTISGSPNAATVIGLINTAAGATIAYADGSQIALIGKAPGGNINIISASLPAVVTQLGFTFGAVVGVPLPAGVIPAGTVVQDASATHIFVTTQDITFGSTGVTQFLGGTTPTQLSLTGPWSVRIRHALDNGTGLAANAGTLTVIPTPPLLLSLNAINLQATTAALTEGQIDAAYVNALAATLDVNTVAQQVNISWSARQSNTVRSALRTNALLASANGCFGRVTCVRPPLGSTRATALSTAAAPGVGATRDQRVFYNYPGLNTFVPIIATRGTAGGLGYTASGNVDVGSDGFLASIMSQLPPEENPGQETPFTTAVNSLETSANAQGFTITDYINFKAAGICSPRIDSNGVCIFQSGVTSVDPNVYPSLTSIARRRMADFIQDSLAQLSLGFGKKLSTNARRKVLAAEYRSFLDQLLNVGSPDNQRIAGYTVDDVTGNTGVTLGEGMFRLIVNVRTLASLDSIVIQSTIGPQVAVVVELPAAA